VFNHHNSKLRTVIEQTFGAVKAKWQMLKCVPRYKGIKQSQKILALCALHNYVHELEGKKTAVTYEQPQGLGPLTQVALMALTDPTDMDQVQEWITFGLGLLGKTTYVLEKLFIHQSFVDCLVGTEQAVINMQVSVYWRRHGQGEQPMAGRRGFQLLCGF
jgi:hypothetical protein